MVAFREAFVGTTILQWALVVADTIFNIAAIWPH
jgi:hypothetical protein